MSREWQAAAGGAGQADEDVFLKLAEMVRAGRQGVLATVTAAARSTPRHPGSKMIVHADGAVTGSVGGGAAEARVVQEARLVLADGRCRTLDLALTGDLGVCGGELTVFLEPVLRAAAFWVVGAGHVGRAVVEMGRGLPFRFVLVDDRPEPPGPAAPDRCPLVQADARGLAGMLQVDPAAAVLIASRSHELDAEYLEAVMRAELAAGREFGFLGGLGSKAKVAVLRRRFQDDPVLSARFARLQLPVGLDLGAETPGEIALSILAEALAVLRGRPPLVDEQGLPLGVRLHRRREP